MKMHGSSTLLTNGHLQIGGCNATELARRFGTPLWVVDEELFRANCRAYRRAFGPDLFPGGAEVVYASKALLTLALCRIVAEEGLSLDVVSGGELHVALVAGFPAERIHFHGNNKTAGEITEALEAGIGRFMVDNLEELQTLERLAGQRRSAGPLAGYARQAVPAEVILRLTPGIEPHTHDYVKTGQIDSQFGFPIETGQALEAVESALAMENIALRGIHCHIGSQVFEVEPYTQAVDVMLEFAALVARKTGWFPEEVDIGGGFAVRYNAQDGDPPAPVDYASAISRALTAKTAELGFRAPKILVEPGRAIAGPSGWTLYTVGNVKDIPGVRTYVAVDGGMSDNPRQALYGARYEACLANRAGETANVVVTIAGRHCECGDILIRDIALPRPAPGDILAVSMTGAYNHAMAMSYNRLLRPAMVLVAHGSAELILERESYADLIARERVPERLAARPRALEPAAGAI